jgi:hypothetical protein
LNSVRELNAGTLAQIQRVCREHTENRDETDAKIDESRPRKLRGSEALVAGSWFAFAWAI